MSPPSLETAPPPMPPPAAARVYAPGDPVPQPWGGLTTFSGTPCGDCGKVWMFEVFKRWRYRRWSLGGAETWRAAISVSCPACLAVDARDRDRERRQHMGWYDLRDGSFSLDRGALALEPPAGIDEGRTK